MPLRGLFYFSRLYAGYVETHNLDIYSRTRLKLPTQKFMILSEYNEELHLKDTYEVGKEEGNAEGENRVNVLNQALIKDNRWEDLKRAAEDKEFQRQLFAEFGL